MRKSPVQIDLESLIPGGIRPDDHVHRGTNDNTCSRCRWEVPEDDVPITISIGEAGDDLLIYCETCLSMPGDGCQARGRLTDEESKAVSRVAALAKARGVREIEVLPDGNEVYAYPHPGGGIAWGVNGGATGYCIARGICREAADV